MIIDLLKNSQMYDGLGAGLAAGLKFLRETDLSGLTPGRHDIQGDDCYAMVTEYDTKPLDEGLWEAHQKYFDIQYVVAGIEGMGYANIETMTVDEPFDEEKDVTFLDGDGDYITVPAGTFVIFTPDDAHMPCLRAEGGKHVKKVVVKVRK